MTHTCRTARRPPGAAGPNPAGVPAVPVPGPGRPAVLVHAARTSRNTAAASSHRRPFAIAIAEIRQAVLRRAPGSRSAGDLEFVVDVDDPAGHQRGAGHRVMFG